MTTTATIPAEWTTASAAAFVAALDSSARQALADALRQDETAGYEAELMDVIRDVLGEDLPRVLGVLFMPTDWDNGLFLDQHATVFYLDGPPQQVDFGDGANEAMTELYGCVGERAGLAVIPATGETEFDDCAADFNLEPWINSQEKSVRKALAS